MARPLGFSSKLHLCFIPISGDAESSELAEVCHASSCFVPEDVHILRHLQGTPQCEVQALRDLKTMSREQPAAGPPTTTLRSLTKRYLVRLLDEPLTAWS